MPLESRGVLGGPIALILEKEMAGNGAWQDRQSYL